MFYSQRFGICVGFILILFLLRGVVDSFSMDIGVAAVENHGGGILSRDSSRSASR